MVTEGGGQEYTYLPERIHMITAQGPCWFGVLGLQAAKASCFPADLAVRSAASFSFSVFAGNENAALIPSFNEI